MPRSALFSPIDRIVAQPLQARHRPTTGLSPAMARLEAEVVMGNAVLQVTVGALALGVLGGLGLLARELLRWVERHPGESALAAIGFEARQALGDWVDEVSESGSWFGAQGDSSFDPSDWLDAGGGESDGHCASDDGGGCGDW